MATISDKIPNTNIMPYGNCKLKTFSPPCVPAPMAWTGFLASVNIPGGNPLLKTSTIQCACGGTIRFQDSGQMKANKVKLNPNSPQIDALKRAALVAAPFCEECEKRKEEKEPKILRIYWMDEQGKPRELSKLEEGQEVTLCIDRIDDFITSDEFNKITIRSKKNSYAKTPLATWYFGDIGKPTKTKPVSPDYKDWSYAVIKYNASPAAKEYQKTVFDFCKKSRIPKTSDYYLDTKNYVKGTKVQ